MKKFSIEIKWGVIFTLIALLWMLFEKQVGWHDEFIADHAIYTNIFAVLAILVYVQALLDKRKNFYGGYMSWKQGFFSGLAVSVVVALFTPLSQYLTNTYISPDFFENVIRYSIESGKMTQTDAEKTYTMQSFIINSFFFALLVGAVTSAIVAIFVAKKAPENSET